MELFDQGQGIILVKLLLAHLLGDFIFQSNSWVEEKRKKGIAAPSLYYHTSVIAILTAIALSFQHIPVLAFISISHAIIDLWKARKTKMGVWVLYSQYEAIGFLITGKSILRFSDKDNPAASTCSWELC